MRIDASTIAWIFYSTALTSSEGPARRSAIAAAADAMNHAIPTEREITSSLAWLKQRGLVTGGRTGYAVTAHGKGFITRARGASRSMLANWERITAAIEKVVHEP